VSAARALRRGKPGKPAHAESTEDPVVRLAKRGVAANAGAWKEKVERRLDGDGGPGSDRPNDAIRRAGLVVIPDHANRAPDWWSFRITLTMRRIGGRAY